MVDLLRIETFLQAADNLKLSEAARNLHLSQPTVSHHNLSSRESPGSDSI